MKSFRLQPEFVDSYRDKEVPWGYQDSAGNALGEITFLRTYSRLKEDGSKETWVDVCKRVIEGMFTIQREHCATNSITWNHAKAQRTAKDAFDRLFNLKWTPPGRGLWMMGTPMVMEQRNSAALQNCAFISTKDFIPAMQFLMEASMLGIGVGFDAKGAGKYQVLKPSLNGTYVVPDTREGWVEAMTAVLSAYLVGGNLPEFDYSEVRPEGAPIKTFGGTASGPGPLIQLIEDLTGVLDKHVGSTLGTAGIADIGNLIGRCVVSGNVRRSAEIFFGEVNDTEFLGLKDYEKNPYRAGWGWLSNNSVFATVGQDLSPIVEGIALNGEPGVAWMDTTRAYGRLVDPPNNKDSRVAGYNPCAEQSLESGECCTLVETYLNRHESMADYLETLKVAYLYGKTVTLLPTHWEQTNTIMQRNRRIGLSMSGIANFADLNGMSTLRNWMDKGYLKVQELDTTYSEWLCVRESIKTTTVKPSGTVSILAGASPGVHWTPGGEYFIRRITFAKNHEMLPLFQAAGYEVEELGYDPRSVAVLFPIHHESKRSDDEVTIFEKIHLAAEAQRWWSDNSVSVTVTFSEDERKDVASVLSMYDGQLKTVSFLPQSPAYAHMPYEKISKERYEESKKNLLPIDLTSVYSASTLDAEGEEFCTTDACLIPATT